MAMLKRPKSSSYRVIKLTHFWFNPKAFVVYAVSLLALAEILDMTIVAVAIPQIMGSIGADLNSIALVTTSYVVSAAICIPLSGLVIKKYGMKNVILISAFTFTITSILCGLATTLPEMILFRIIQGIGGAFLPSVAQAYISQTYSDKEEQKMMSLFSLVVVMGPAIGPVLGGYLTANLSWRWVFYINVPICVTAFVLIFIFMHDQIKKNIQIDYISFVFMMIGIGCLEYFIDEGNKNNWFDSIEMIIILVTSFLALSFFIWRGLLGSSVINLKVFKNLNFNLCCITVFCFSTLITGALAFFPTFLQQLYHYPADVAGRISAPRGLTAIVCAPLIAVIMNKIGSRATMFIGVFVFSLACFILSTFSVQLNQSHILLVTMIMQGFGLVAFFIPIMRICFIGFTSEESNDVAGVFNFFRNFGISVGTSIAATIISYQMQVNYHALGHHISPYANGFSWWSQGLQVIPEQIQVAIAQAQIKLQSSMISYLDSYYFFSLGLLLMLWMPLVLKRSTLQDSQHVIH